MSVRDGQGTVLFSQSDVPTTAIGHDTPTFSPPLQAQVLIIAIDTCSLGATGDNVAIDNIAFCQFSAPNPVESKIWCGVKTFYR